MKNIFRGRKIKYGSVSLALTVLVVAAVIIINAAFSALAYSYGWGVNMSSEFAYGISEKCEAYLENTIFPLMDKANKASGEKNKIKIIFCDELENLDDELSQEYVLNSILELKEKYPDRIATEHLNVWENPKLAKTYGVTSDSDIVFVFGDKYTTLSIAQFYVMSDGNTETPTAYNGERRIASAFLRIVSNETPTCYFTLNHGEGLDDSELMFLVADAGYNYAFIDLSTEEIPSDCALLVTVNPTHDIREESSISAVSETQKLDNYMAAGGKYMVLLSPNTFASGALPKFEKFLGAWGVNYMHSSNKGVENCYLLRDTANSVLGDAYNVLAKTSENATAKSIFGEMSKKAVFAQATAISPADGFKSDGNGNFVSGERTMSPILSSYSSAEAWAGGEVVARATDSPFTLMSATTQKTETGKTACLVAGTSVAFCSEDALQSTVYGNGEALMRVFEYMGNKTSPMTLTSRPLQPPPIQSLTNRNAVIITVVLCAAPATIATLAGIFVLVRRKRS